MNETFSDDLISIRHNDVVDVKSSPNGDVILVLVPSPGCVVYWPFIVATTLCNRINRILHTRKLILVC